MTNGDGLARVTYLPGVVPESLVAGNGAQPEKAHTGPSPEAPTFTAFFGEASAGAEEPVPTGPTRPTGRSERSMENTSMHALTRRGMSRWELEKTLLSRGFDENEVADELDRLERVGLLDDASLAETLVRTQHERKGLGRSALIGELRRRHIGQEHIEAALEQIDADDEQARANELAVKRASQLSSYDLETAKRRLNGFLMRKGYSSSVVRAAVDEALAGHRPGKSGGVRFV
ncbi:hypothetical protein BH09ACT6_BH09ACT6_17860 [soil metagenome]